ncbi:hypothetical protein L9F63_005862, partial [Diploptera punctata]
IRFESHSNQPEEELKCDISGVRASLPTESQQAIPNHVKIPREKHELCNKDGANVSVVD